MNTKNVIGFLNLVLVSVNAMTNNYSDSYGFITNMTSDSSYEIYWPKFLCYLYVMSYACNLCVTYAWKNDLSNTYLESLFVIPHYTFIATSLMISIDRRLPLRVDLTNLLSITFCFNAIVCALLELFRKFYLISLEKKWMKYYWYVLITPFICCVFYGSVIIDEMMEYDTLIRKIYHDL
jgi:hypothetical protein